MRIELRTCSSAQTSMIPVELACLFGEPGRAINTNRYDLRPEMRCMESDVCQINLRRAFFLSSDLDAAYELHGRSSRRTAGKNGIVGFTSQIGHRTGELDKIIPHRLGAIDQFVAIATSITIAFMSAG